MRSDRGAAAVTTLLRRWHARHAAAHPLPLGTHAYWQQAYAATDRGRAPSEWFLEAAAAADEVRTAHRLHGSGETGALRALHVGCGTSHLGAALADTFGPRLARVVNTDFSAAALATLEAELDGRAEQEYLLSDMSSEGCALPQADLVVDKGTLDAVVFAGAPSTANFLCAVRDCMAPGAVYVHFTEEPPDYRTEVIEAAFDAERWRIATATVEDDDSVPNTYFRYSVWRREDVG